MKARRTAFTAKGMAIRPLKGREQQNHHFKRQSMHNCLFHVPPDVYRKSNGSPSSVRWTTGEFDPAAELGVFMDVPEKMISKLKTDHKSGSQIYDRRLISSHDNTQIGSDVIGHYPVRPIFACENLVLPTSGSVDFKRHKFNNDRITGLTWKGPYLFIGDARCRD